MKSAFCRSTGILFLLFAVPALWGADDVQSLLARAKQAAGGEALDRVRTIHTHLRVNAGGLEGTGETWQDARTGRFRFEAQLGPASETDGFDGATLWSLDSAKLPHREQGEDSLLGNADDAYRRRVAARIASWSPAREQAASRRAAV